MGHNFSGAGSIPRAIGFVVIALYPEVKVAPASHHLIVGLLIVVEPFAVVHVVFDVTAAIADSEIDDVGTDNYSDGDPYLKEFVLAH